MSINLYQLVLVSRLLRRGGLSGRTERDSSRFRMSSSLYSTLYSLAEDQMGYVTASQGRGAGVSAEAMVMMERRGRLERVSRGVYRLVEFPTVSHAQYMQATLWPYGCRGVLSHETALSLYQLSDVAPAKVHITVLVQGFPRTALTQIVESDDPDAAAAFFDLIAPLVQKVRWCARHAALQAFATD